MRYSELVKLVYEEMGLSPPEVAPYPSLAKAISDFSCWRSKIERIVPALWDYQYPVLHPDGYWAKFQLFDEGFQIDLKRDANTHGCYVNANYNSRIPVEAAQLHRYYLQAAIEAYRDVSPTPLDQVIKGLTVSGQSFLEEILTMRDAEDDSLQAPLEGHLFLGALSWIRVEYQMLRKMREWIGKPVCGQHFENTKLLYECDAALMTFGNFVIVAPL